ncbi:hypothetical protein MLD38_025961 [Melastoma candidum]|uniref:Uncharacterized protein n=1 Tax=Melastoma candidum TaxID=119954 RepID=A0ACB9P3V2_9MYRT|nr:hypothetical protein MLD38_025961 [Melastoma candidum]
MAFSDHLTPVDPWTNHPPTSFLDPWFSHALSHETETLTRALQMSLSSSPSTFAASSATPSDSTTNNSSDTTTTLNADVVSPSLIPTWGLPAPTLEAAAAAPKQRQRKPGVSSGKVAKRKPRPTKRSQTTFITADVANFRQMVQQVTGSRLGHLPTANLRKILRPEPHRSGDRFPAPSSWGLIGSNGDNACLASITSCLPTLDTSAFLLDRHSHQDEDDQQQHNPQQQEQQGVMETVRQGGSVDQVSTPPPSTLGEDLVPFWSFPTLESCNSM